jgi:hypothetical protein
MYVLRCHSTCLPYFRGDKSRRSMRTERGINIVDNQTKGNTNESSEVYIIALGMI